MQSRPAIFSRIVPLAVAALLVAACGNKGSLTLPPQPEAPPKKAAAPAATPASTSVPAVTPPAQNHNSTTTPPSQ
jgi:predicted small lipoprotein YifL